MVRFIAILRSLNSMIVHNWTCVFHEDLAKDKRTHCRTVVWPNRGRPAGEERYR